MGTPMKHLSLALFLGLAPWPALAELDLPYLKEATSQHGALTIIPADLDGFPGHQLALNGTAVEGTQDAFVDIVQVIAKPGAADVDLVLLAVASGGNACPTLWQWVEVGAAGPQPQDAFGTCSEGLLDLRTEGDSVVIDMASFDPAVQKVSYAYAGGSVIETIVPFSDEGAVAAGAGDQATRWVGRHPMMPFEDAGERLRFKAIMTEEQVFELAGRVTVASEAYEADGFVIGEGFDPNSGGDVAGLWGIRVTDGAPFAIFRTTGEEPQVFGLSDVDMPGAIRLEDLPAVADTYLSGLEE
jgi:hypothetical protein